MQIASIFLNVDKRMIGLRFDTGLLGFPGFYNGTSIPWFISFGQSPSGAIWLNISAVLS